MRFGRRAQAASSHFQPGKARRRSPQITVVGIAPRCAASWSLTDRNALNVAWGDYDPLGCDFAVNTVPSVSTMETSSSLSPPRPKVNRKFGLVEIEKVLSMWNTRSLPALHRHLLDEAGRDIAAGIDIELHAVRVRVLEHHLRFEQGRGGERRREGLHQHLAEIDIFRVGVLGVHGRAAASGLHELGRHVQAPVLGLEDRPHMGETIDAHAGGDRPLAAGSCGGTEVEFRHHRVRIFVDDQGERFEFVPDFGRHAHRKGNERGILAR